MITTYKCEVCGFTSDSREAVAACEEKCRLANLLDEFFGNDGWSPPLLLARFNEWSKADRAEMARRISLVFDKHFRD